MPSLTTYLLTLTSTFTLIVNGLSIPDLFPRGVGGINCRGATNCAGYKGDLSTILAKVNDIPHGRTYHAGDPLACAGFSTTPNNYGNQWSKGDGICAMVGENTSEYVIGAGAEGHGQMNSAGDVIKDLIDHGCEACGTAPTVREGGNDNGRGAITVNYVKTVCSSYDNEPCQHIA